MSDHPRYTLNRGVVMLRYRQPFLDWLNSIDPAQNNLTLEGMNNMDGEVFLIPDNSTEPIEACEDYVQWVEMRWRIFFEHMLGYWLADEALWPKKLTLKMFREWFTIEYRSMVWDMGHEPLSLEDWFNDDDDFESNDTLH